MARSIIANNDEWLTRASNYFGTAVSKIILGQPLDGWEMQIKNALMASCGPIPESPTHYISRRLDSEGE